MVLASASPRRSEILTGLGFDVEVRPSAIDETALPGEGPGAYVRRLAEAKARAGVGSEREFVVGGDTVVVHDGRLLGKPADARDAVRMLRSLSGRSHEVISAVALAHDGRVRSAVSRTEVRFRAFDEVAAAAYVATGEPLDKAGAYGIQGRGAALVAGIRGDYYTVVGLPIVPFLDLLHGAGWAYDFTGLRPRSSTP